MSLALLDEHESRLCCDCTISWSGRNDTERLRLDTRIGVTDCRDHGAMCIDTGGSEDGQDDRVDSHIVYVTRTYALQIWQKL